MCDSAQETRVEHVIYSNVMFNDTIYSIHILDFGIIYATMTCACWCVWGVNALALAPAHSVPLARFIVACVAAMRIVRRFSFSLFIHIRIILFSDSLIIWWQWESLVRLIDSIRMTQKFTNIMTNGERLL